MMPELLGATEELRVEGGGVGYLLKMSCFWLWGTAAYAGV